MFDDLPYLSHISFQQVNESLLTSWIPFGSSASLLVGWGVVGFVRRLDSVVTVVDADALVHQLKDGQEKSMPIALRKQLESADVILLNKVDLLDTDR